MTNKHTQVTTVAALSGMIGPGGFRWVASPYEGCEIGAVVKDPTHIGHYIIRLISDEGVTFELASKHADERVTVEEDPFVGL